PAGTLAQSYPGRNVMALSIWQARGGGGRAGLDVDGAAARGAREPGDRVGAPQPLRAGGRMGPRASGADREQRAPPAGADRGLLDVAGGDHRRAAPRRDARAGADRAAHAALRARRPRRTPPPGWLRPPVDPLPRSKGDATETGATG